MAAGGWNGMDMAWRDISIKGENGMRKMEGNWSKNGEEV